MTNDREFEQLITWGIRRQTTCAAIILTFLVASIQLFFNIPENQQTGFWSSLLSWGIIFLHIIFFIGFLVSIDRFIQLYQNINAWENSIKNDILRQEIERGKPKYHKYFLYTHLNILVISISIICWLVLLIPNLIVQGFIN
jgi:hypothetical protein